MYGTGPYGTLAYDQQSADLAQANAAAVIQMGGMTTSSSMTATVTTNAAITMGKQAAAATTGNVAGASLAVTLGKQTTSAAVAAAVVISVTKTLGGQLLSSTSAAAITANLIGITNYVPNSTMAGATTTTLPTGWSFQAAAGLTHAIVDKGVEFGLDYVDWSVTGTAVGSVNPALFMTPAGAFAPAPVKLGDVVTQSVYSRLVSGAYPNGYLSHLTQRFTPAGSYLGAQQSTNFTTTDFRRQSSTSTIVDTVANLDLVMSPGTILNGVTVNMVVRIYAPQLEKAPQASLFIPTSTGAVSAALIGDQPSINYFVNSMMVGGIVGGTVVGTGIDVGEFAAGITGTVVARDPLTGTCDVRFVGTSGAVKIGAIVTSIGLAQYAMPVVQGDDTVVSATVQLLAGTIPSGQSYLVSYERTAANAAVGAGGTGSGNLRTALATGTPVYASAGGPVIASNAAKMTAKVVFEGAVSEVVDFTVRISGLQMEKGRLTPTAHIATYNKGVRSRASFGSSFDGVALAYDRTANFSTTMVNTSAVVDVDAIAGVHLSQTMAPATIGSAVQLAINAYANIATGSNASKNEVPDSTFSSAVVGVIGSGGALPTGASMGVATGVTREVIAKGLLPNGRHYMDIRVAGTNASGAIVYPDLYFIPPATVVAALGETWSGQIGAQIIAGSRAGFANTNTVIGIVEQTAPSTFLGATYMTLVGGSFQDLNASRVLSFPAADRVRFYVDFSIPAGGTVDVTMRFVEPQLQKGPRTSFIPTFGTAVYRPAFGQYLTALVMSAISTGFTTLMGKTVLSATIGNAILTNLSKTFARSFTASVGNVAGASFSKTMDKTTLASSTSASLVATFSKTMGKMVLTAASGKIPRRILMLVRTLRNTDP